MSKKTIAGALAALTLVASMATMSTEAQAGNKWGIGLGIGIAAGALIASSAYHHGYAGHYVYEPDYGCRLVHRVNRYGHIRVVKICDVIPY